MADQSKKSKVEPIKVKKSKAKKSKPEKIRMLEKFMSTALNNRYNSYRSYQIVKVKDEIRLYRLRRIIAKWDFVTDQITISEELSPTDRTVTRRFATLPALAEISYREKMGIPEVDSSERLVQQEIEEMLKEIPDSELAKENALDQLIHTLADQFCDFLHDRGNPDHYNDHYLNYIKQTESTVTGILHKVNDQRVKNLLFEKEAMLGKTRIEAGLPYTEQELAAMLRIIPLRAQREGNLLTISDENQQRFEQFCNEALEFAREHFTQHGLAHYYPKQEVEVQWWEKNDGPDRFFVPEVEAEETPLIVQGNLSAFRLALLQKPRPKPLPRAKPSRLKLLLYFDERDTQGNVFPLMKKAIHQKGIINWYNYLGK